MARITSVLDTLTERGYIGQLSHEIEIRKLLIKEKISCFIRLDSSIDSLNLGHFVQIMVMAHMQRAGHKPIILIDEYLSNKDIVTNSNRIKKQMEKIIDFAEEKAAMVNNSDWLPEIKYMDFLVEVGKYFSVPRMLTAECFNQETKQEISYLDLNSMVMKAYDFLELSRKYESKLQLGIDKEWFNIIAGTDLIRKKEGKATFGMSIAQLEEKELSNAENKVISLDKEKTSPADFYKYFRNVEEQNLERYLSFFTFLPIGQIKRFAAMQGRELNEGKKALAFEATKIVHGKDAAHKARTEIEALLAKEGNEKDMPSIYISRDVFNTSVVDILIGIKILVSKGEGQRFIDQGSLYVNDAKITSIETPLTEADFSQGSVIIRRGKKNYTRLILK